MTRGLFDEDPVGDIFGAMFGGLGAATAPPDSVPLRILGLGSIPSTRDAVKAAFRAKVMTAHPDLGAYTIPHLRQAAEAAVSQEADVQELVWARDVILRKVPTPVTGADVSRGDAIKRYEPQRCKGCDDVHKHHGGKVWRFVRLGRWVDYCYPCAEKEKLAERREQRAKARADRCCETCGSTFTPRRADGRYCRSACRQMAYRQRQAS